MSATVSRTPSGKYFVALCCTDVDIKKAVATGKVVGLDMGIESFAVSSSGEIFENHKHLAKSQIKLAKLQRRLSRKSKGSNGLSCPVGRYQRFKNPEMDLPGMWHRT